MMIVADLETGTADAIEDAFIGAWELQAGKGQCRRRGPDPET